MKILCNMENLGSIFCLWVAGSNFFFIYILVTNELIKICNMNVCLRNLSLYLQVRVLYENKAFVYMFLKSFCYRFKLKERLVSPLDVAANIQFIV